MILNFLPYTSLNLPKLLAIRIYENDTAGRGEKMAMKSVL